MVVTTSYKCKSCGALVGPGVDYCSRICKRLDQGDRKTPGKSRTIKKTAKKKTRKRKKTSR